ncbi:MAG: hypothetical protein NT130_02505 [Candidatus Micrarchaeota archaeon]|nr:hypothetical protein [Candidatus Micrarchaeota archaeon]
MNEKELKDSMNVAAIATFWGGRDWKRTVHYMIPSNAFFRYYLNLLVLLLLPLLLIVALLSWSAIPLSQQTDIIYGLLLLEAVIFLFSFTRFAPFLFRPISNWMLENVKCPSCNEKIKKVTWGHKVGFRLSPDFCEVQCKRCSRRFVFTRINNTLLLTDEIRV